MSVYYRTLISNELGVEVDLLTNGEGQDVDIDEVRIHRIPRFGVPTPGPRCGVVTVSYSELHFEDSPPSSVWIPNAVCATLAPRGQHDGGQDPRSFGKTAR